MATAAHTQRPRHSEIETCRPWFDAELSVVRPKAVVCLGASAAQALLGQNFRVMQSRGTHVQSGLAKYVIATTHPASILRAPDHAPRDQQRKDFVRDLKKSPISLQLAIRRPPNRFTNFRCPPSSHRHPAFAPGHPRLNILFGGSREGS